MDIFKVVPCHCYDTEDRGLTALQMLGSVHIPYVKVCLYLYVYMKLLFFHILELFGGAKPGCRKVSLVPCTLGLIKNYIIFKLGLRCPFFSCHAFLQMIYTFYFFFEREVTKYLIICTQHGHIAHTILL